MTKVCPHSFKFVKANWGQQWGISKSNYNEFNELKGKIWETKEQRWRKWCKLYDHSKKSDELQKYSGVNHRQQIFALKQTTHCIHEISDLSIFHCGAVSSQAGFQFIECDCTAIISVHCLEHFSQTSNLLLRKALSYYLMAAKTWIRLNAVVKLLWSFRVHAWTTMNIHKCP